MVGKTGLAPLILNGGRVNGATGDINQAMIDCLRVRRIAGR